MQDWRTAEDDREKYQLYLASREWAVKKEAVAARARKTCERCKYHPMNAVHHLTYARKYNELLTDLLGVCKGCHEFIHAKSSDDPRETCPAMFLGEKIKKIYLAGKITGDSWRDDIADEWSQENHGPIDDAWIGVCKYTDGWVTVPGCISMPDGRDRLDMTGPWWRPFGSGHGSKWDNPTSHANGFSSDFTEEYKEIAPGEWVELPVVFIGNQAESQSRTFTMIRDAILDSDLVFAWIDSLDCFGTLAEIGFAYGWNKQIAIGVPVGFDWSQLWVTFQMANRIVEADADSDSPAKSAWDKLW